MCVSVGDVREGREGTNLSQASEKLSAKQRSSSERKQDLTRHYPSRRILRSFRMHGDSNRLAQNDRNEKVDLGDCWPNSRLKDRMSLENVADQLTSQ